LIQEFLELHIKNTPRFDRIMEKQYYTPIRVDAIPPGFDRNFINPTFMLRWIIESSLRIHCEGMKSGEGLIVIPYSDTLFSDRGGITLAIKNKYVRSVLELSGRIIIDREGFLFCDKFPLEVISRLIASAKGIQYPTTGLNIKILQDPVRMTTPTTSGAAQAAVASDSHNTEGGAMTNEDVVLELARRNRGA
jgi:hypothetical protein